MEKTCDHCGSIIKLTEHKSPMRDKDHINCPNCGELLIEWDGGYYYSNPIVIKKGPR